MTKKKFFLTKITLNWPSNPHQFLPPNKIVIVNFIHQVALARRQRRTFRSSSQAATCPLVYHTRRRLHTVPLIAERQADKL